MHDYRSKDEIFVELIGKAFAVMNEAAIGHKQGTQTPREKLETALTQLLHSIRESDTFVRTVLLIHQASVSAAIPEKLKMLIQEEGAVPYEVMARIFSAGQADGSIRQGDPDAPALVFWTVVKGLAMRKASHGVVRRGL